MEAVGGEGVRGGIVFEDLAGIAAAGRKIDEAAFHAGRAARAMEHPILVLLGIVFVDVQEHVPFGIGIPVVRHARAAPQPAHMVAVLPEIVNIAVIDLARGDAILRVERGKDLRADLRIEGIALELGVADRVLVLHPSERFLTVDVGEPVIGILRIVGTRRHFVHFRQRRTDAQARAERRQNPFSVFHHTLQ